MDVWITGIEWSTQGVGLPQPNVDAPLKLAVRDGAQAEPCLIGDALADMYQAYPKSWDYRLYEPGSTVPDWINKVPGYEWCKFVGMGKLTDKEHGEYIAKLKKKYE